MTDTVPARLREQVATRQNDPTYSAAFLDVLSPQDDVLRQRGGGKGLKLYEELERDAQVFAVLQKRRLAIVGREWVMEPGGESRQDRKAAQVIEQWLRSMPFDRWCLDLAGALLMGFAAAEPIWGVWDDTLIAPLSLKHLQPRRVVFDVNDRPRLLTRQAPMSGALFGDKKVIVHRAGTTDDPYGLGLGRVLFWPVFFKRQNIAYWMIFQERFGSPTVKAIHENASEAEQDKMEVMLSRMGQQGYVVAPTGWEIGLLETARSGTLTYADLCKYMDAEIAKAVLGETLSTDQGDRGSQALGNVHNEVRMELTDSDCDLLSATVNEQLLAWVTEINFPGARPPRLWRPRPEREEDQAKARAVVTKARDADRAFIAAMRRDGWEPEDPAADLEGQASGAWRYGGNPTPEPAPRNTPPQPADFAEPRRDALDDLADQLDTVAAPGMDALINRIRDLVDQVDAEGGTLQDVADRLITLYPQMDNQALGQAMVQAMTVAALQGRADILAGVAG